MSSTEILILDQTWLFSAERSSGEVAARTDVDVRVRLKDRIFYPDALRFFDEGGGGKKVNAFSRLGC
jgi:hypothetical protein